MTSVNALVAGNVAITTHSRLGITSIRIVAIANSTIEGFTEAIVPGQIEEHEAHLTYKQSCLVKGDHSFESKHGLLFGKSIVDPSKEIPVRGINTLMWSSKIYAGKRIANLASLVTENQLEVYTVSKHEQSIDNLINSSIYSNESILKLDETQILKLLLVKYKNIISCDSNDLGRCLTLEHQIDTGNTAPIQMAPRRIPYHQQKEVQHDIAEKEHSGIIKKSSSPGHFLLW